MLIATYMKIYEIRMTLFYGLNKKMEKSAFVFSILCIWKLRKVGYIKSYSLLISWSSVHYVSHKQYELQNLSKFRRLQNLQETKLACIICKDTYFFTSCSGSYYIWFTVLYQLRKIKLESERLQSWYKSVKNQYYKYYQSLASQLLTRLRPAAESPWTGPIGGRRLASCLRQAPGGLTTLCILLM